jgi:dTDP-glucose pyrophosphorylase/CBS domain-containing protein
VNDVAKLFVSLDSSIRDAIVCIDRSAVGIALVVDGDRRLIATITDGDIRRALLAGVDFARPVQVLIDERPAVARKVPMTAPSGTEPALLLDLMSRQVVRHIPLVDPRGRVVDIALLSDFIKTLESPMRALVMAGGFGTRLRPLTDELPKPMLPMGDRPLLEVIVQQLQQAGIRHVSISRHYKGDQIEQHFGDGHRFNVDIEYVDEDQPLGTAGAVGLLANGVELANDDDPLLVVNGDILTQVNYAAMLDFHCSNRADLTVAVRPFEVQVPYGVVDTDGVLVRDVDEKPIIRNFINAGIYLLNTRVRRLVPAGERYDMTQLIRRAVAERFRVISFPLREYWLDIGQSDDYARAVADMKEKKV